VIPARTGIWCAAAIIGVVLLGGCEAQPSPRSLKEAETRMTVRTDAPETHMALVTDQGGTDGAGQESQFALASDETLFREAEVAPDRVEEARLLLTELGAREQEDRSIRFDLPADILFDFDKATLRPDAAPALEKALRLVAAYPKAPLSVAGHTDAKGDDAYNDALSKRRAATVAEWIKAKTGREVGARGYGERTPVAPNTHPDGSDDPEGRQRNRRVEIILLPLRDENP